MLLRPIFRLLFLPFRLAWAAIDAFSRVLLAVMVATNPVFLAIWIYRQWEKDQEGKKRGSTKHPRSPYR